MSLKVTLEETPREFDVKIGCNTIGRVRSFRCDTSEEDNEEELYEATLFIPGEDGDDEEDLGYWNTIEEAGVAVVEWAHGPTKINKIITRPV